jgi:hypothetical protein
MRNILLPALVVLAVVACHPSVPAVRAAAVSAVTMPFSLTIVPEQRVQLVFHVAGGNPSASDSNTGTETLPFRTISTAVKAALRQKNAGVGVKVLIHPGEYREQVVLSLQAKETDAPLVIEGAERGMVILSGSDIWDGWQRQGTPNVYTHAWPYRWGEAPYPAGWEGNVVLAPIVRRREMVFVDGAALVQVLSAGELVDNSFFVSEADGSITIQVTPGLQIDRAKVEVATRSPILSAQGKTNLVLRKLAFRHGNSAVPDSAVQITDSTGVLVEDCDFAWNNWDGFDVLVSNDVTVRRSVGNNNGGSGLGGYKLKRFVMDSSDSSFNNWRGAQGQFFGWAVAGAKFGAIHDGLVIRHRALANQSRGLWFDYDTVNLSIEHCGLYSNKTDGLFIEANQGPVAIRDSLIMGNVEGSGVLGSNSSDVTISGSAIWANGLAQIQMTGVDSRAVSNWETGVTLDVRPERWTIVSSLIWAEKPNQLWLLTPNWPAFLTSLNSRANVWSRPADPKAFQIGSKQISLSGWQQTTSTDLDSTAYIR